MSSPICAPGSYQIAAEAARFQTLVRKHTRLRESADLEFRAEFFNLTNTPAFAQPNGVLGSAAFGTIVSTATDPRVVQFGLKLNY